MSVAAAVEMDIINHAVVQLNSNIMDERIIQP